MRQAERVPAREVRRSDRIRLLQTVVELAKLGWEIGNRLWP
jgi:hypothetical protein